MQGVRVREGGRRRGLCLFSKKRANEERAAQRWCSVNQKQVGARLIGGWITMQHSFLSAVKRFAAKD